MPATRSRTTNWRDALQQIHQRQGSIEITPPSNTSDTGETIAPALMSRARIIALDSNTIAVEQPTTLGHAIELREGADIVAVMHIGQNRWSFKTRVLSTTPPSPRSHSGSVTLAMPEGVERCPRRSFYRLPAQNLDLATVRTFPLIDPHSAPVAQAVARQRFTNDDPVQTDDNADLARPTVGPAFDTTLLNIGGGGVGLLVNAEDRATISKHKLFWLEISLGELVRAPLPVAAKLRHANPDASQNAEAGFAFHFNNDPAHETFVVEQITAYMRALQRLNERQTDPGQTRRAA